MVTVDNGGERGQMAANRKLWLVAAVVLLAMSAEPATANPDRHGRGAQRQPVHVAEPQERFRNKANKLCRANVSMGASATAICFVGAGSPPAVCRPDRRQDLRTRPSATLARPTSSSCSARRQRIHVQPESAGPARLLGHQCSGENSREHEFSSTTFLPCGEPAKRYTNVATGDGLPASAHRQRDGQIFCAGEFLLPDGRVPTNTAECW